MDGLSLIRASRAVGLSVAIDGDRLVIKGPKSAGAVAEALIGNKAIVMSALTEALARGVPLDWPDDARDHFLERLGVADDLGLTPVPGSDAWAIAVAEANRIAANVPVPEGGLNELRLIDHALSAFAPLGGLTLDRLTTRESLGLPEPTAQAPRNDRTCRWCLRTCWWSLKPGAAQRTCAYCSPPAPHLKVTWHTKSRAEQDAAFQGGAS